MEALFERKTVRSGGHNCAKLNSLGSFVAAEQ